MHVAYKYYSCYCRNECSVIEAGVNGAAIAGKTVGTVIVSFIGFISFLEAIDGILGWVGGKVGYGTLSYQVKFISVTIESEVLKHNDY